MEKITKNFSKSEFESKDGAPMPDNAHINVVKLACQLQTLRNKLGVPVIVNSGYRSPNHNDSVGGADNSQHLYGKAADIRTTKFTPKQIYDTIERLISKGDMLQGGLGLYNTFVHYDIRKKRARWDNSTY